MKNIIKNLNLSQLKNNNLKLKSGYFVDVNFYIDSNKKKNQIFSGLIISIKNKSFLTSIIVRKISYNVGVEKTFYIHAPNIKKIVINKIKKYRKSKLYFLRKISRL
ncbi:50S ribosomal protein L19 [endosymbiont of Euscepes postfasciatus]|uniref:50S ribosomal protein L19 n=1 Tax=endosymbiont of Euscepes postfasciatus TaxID=650377 RepID=UPI000DC6F8C2|nr:50S ribosomal protein L19 [endosymbiont of Euscepes postfasciatus]BBA84648.1 50S ribosomal protein L19 [endosymbiont of Euscepes postfasciatus]